MVSGLLKCLYRAGNSADGQGRAPYSPSIIQPNSYLTSAASAHIQIIDDQQHPDQKITYIPKWKPR